MEKSPKLKEKTEELSKVAMDLAAKVYQNVNPNNAGNAENATSNNDGVEEATFEEK